MKSKRLLLKNAFRSSWKGKTQLIGISLLVMLMTTILSLLSSSYEQIDKKGHQLNRASNLRDGIFDVQNSRRVDYGKVTGTGEEKKEEPTLLNNQTYLFQYLFDKLATEYDLTWSRTEARSFSKLGEDGERQVNMKVVSKTSSDKSEGVKVDALVVNEGSNFSNPSKSSLVSDREIIINKTFASTNNVKIGDIIRIEKDNYGKSLLVKNSKKANEIPSLDPMSNETFANNAWFHVIGFGTSADFATPITDQTTVFPEAAANFIGYVKPKNFGLIPESETGFVSFDQTQSLLYGTEFGKESYLSFEYNSKHHNTNEMTKRFNELIGVDTNNKIVYLTDDSSYLYSSRVQLFASVIAAYNTIAILLFLVTTFISMFALSIVLKKRVEAVKSQMGCLKALGYWKKEILLNFIAIPAITATIGVTLGYILSLGLSLAVISTFSSYFTISFGAFTFSIISFFSSWLVGIVLLTLIASMLILMEIKKPALTLLKGRNDVKFSYVGNFIQSVFKKSKFDTRLRMSIFAGSWVKFLGTFITILISSILITFTSITPTIIAKNETASFDGMDYKFVTEYQQPIAENPLSFYKTFNPNHSKTDKNHKYGYKGTEKLISDYISPTYGKTKVYTPLPTVKNEVKNENDVIDYTTLFDDLMKGNISRFNYSPNIVYNDDIGGGMGAGSSRMAYLNYQMLTEAYLNALDKYEITHFSLAGSILKQQWTDLIMFEENIKKISSLESNLYVDEYIKLVHTFYKKYINGLPITFNNNLIIDKKAEVKKIDIEKLEKQMNSSVAYKNLKNKVNEPEGIIASLEIKKTIPGESEDIIFLKSDINPNGIDLFSTSTDTLLSEKFEIKEKEQLAIEMASWFNLFIDGRISMYLMQTAYSRAPYFVQENMKNAFKDIESSKDGQEFSISFNVVPFDPSLEMKGTMMKTKVKDDISVNIYGIDPSNNINLIDLSDSNNNDLTNDLFDSVYKDPIIINESLAKLMNVKQGDSIYLDINNNVLENKDGDIISADISQTKKYDNYISESSRSYQSTNGKNFADASIFKLKPVKLGGYDVSATTSSNSTKQTKINGAMADGEIISTTNKKTKRFVVAGIQKSYGQPQAWTDNEIANEVMNFDDARDIIFENWFKNFDLPNKEINEYLTQKIDSNISESNEKKSLRTSKSVNAVKDDISLNNYKYLYSMANSSVQNAEIYNDYLTIFENTYPIFNYKYSVDPIHNDIVKSMATTSPNGDFSAVGLNGAFSYVKKDPECVDPAEGEEGKTPCEMVPDPSKFIEGYAVGATALSVPMDQARIVLSQLTELVKMITIMFIVFAMIIASIIILLVTSIVISENTQFIATMKLLGYRKRYIVWQIISIYLIAILVAYAIGFTGGWFTFVGVTDMLAQGGSWILPVSFEIWMPFMVAGLLSIVFLLTFYAAYEKIRKLTPMQALDS